MAEKILMVVAKVSGQYGQLWRQAGAKFVLAKEQDFSHNWMQADGWTPAPKAPTPGLKAVLAENESLKAQAADLKAENESLKGENETLKALADESEKNLSKANETIKSLKAQAAGAPPKKANEGPATEVKKDEQKQL